MKGNDECTMSDIRKKLGNFKLFNIRNKNYKINIYLSLNVLKMI